uniref:Uncharacterized protein n=1 Tax=Octopus bimaculoides TaxID=37653 RepID=A0A0L8GQR7_OCTBM
MQSSNIHGPTISENRPSIASSLNLLYTVLTTPNQIPSLQLSQLKTPSSSHQVFVQSSSFSSDTYNRNTLAFLFRGIKKNYSKYSLMAL